jgi:hypothetical protein
LKSISFIAMLVLSAVTAQSQSTVNRQSLYWIRYHNHLYFSPAFYWNNEVDNRRFFHPDVQNQLIIHSHVHLKKKKWDFGTGLTLSWIYSQVPEQGYDQAVNEVRAVVEASHELAFKKFSFQNRVRVDHRFFQEDLNKSVFEESFYVLRFRYRAQLTIPLKSNDLNETVMGLRVADEIMLNHTENTFDQNRIYATFEFRISKSMKIETGYIYIYQQRLGLDEFFKRHVARLTLFHKMSLH